MLLPNIHFDHDKQCFEQGSALDVGDMVNSMNVPLSLTLQLTRGCNLKCVYCSEPPGIRSLKLDDMKRMMDKLHGMRRIILSGGEPLLYKHFWEVLEYAREKFEVVVLSTNAVYITKDVAKRLVPLVDYVDITVDGARAQHDDIRGNYDGVMRGLMNVAYEGMPFSVICVFLPRNKDALGYICHTGDVFGAKKVKILTPIPKGKSVNLFQNFITGNYLQSVVDDLQQQKAENGWKVRITATDWMRVGPGHAILVEPDGRMIASPVWDEPECILPFGNLAEDDISELWARYPYKENHLKKYLEQTLLVV